MATVTASRKVCVLATVSIAYDTTNTWLGAQRVHPAMPKRCDLAWPEASPRTAVRQFYSGMLSADKPCRLAKLLYPDVCIR